MRRPATLRLEALLLLAFSVFSARSLAETTPLVRLRYSSDVTTVLWDTTVGPNVVANDDLLGNVTLVPFGAIPAGAHVDGYAVNANGDQLLSFDTAVVLGGTTFLRNDVVRFDGSSFTRAFGGAANGLPDGADVKDFAVDGASNLIIAFDTTVTLGGVTLTPRDLAYWNASTSAFGVYFSGAGNGIPASLAIDGVHALPNGHLLFSFDGSGELGGVVFDDEDVLEWTPGAPGTWEMAYRGSIQQPSGWPAADLLALDASPSIPSVTTSPSGTAILCTTPITLTASPAGGSGTYVGYRWYRDGQSIAGADASTYDAALPGTYTVTVTDSVGLTSAPSADLVLTAETTEPTVTPPSGAMVTQTLCS